MPVASPLRTEVKNKQAPDTPIKKSCVRRHKRYHESSFWKMDILGQDIDIGDEVHNTSGAENVNNFSPLRMKVEAAVPERVDTQDHL